MLSTAKIGWQCRRGMLELDALLQPFFYKQFDKLSLDEQLKFETLLTFSDPELYAWLLGYEKPENVNLHGIITLVRSQ